ncbi:MAG: pentapeptide repeat-containing protein [Aphanocapsa sp. GSE-SYN-MK-11-07L]|nr:pentapeptide repeat-containing protein [Aphanocapsa sp. GSE-SYN-MK-11-07L]
MDDGEFGHRLTAEELLERYAAGERDFRKVNLREACLSGANLCGINLSRARLSDADLSGINLSEAKLSDADLSRTNLERANLVGARSNRSDLSRANLRGANLERAELRLANLKSADFRDANLSFSDTDESSMDRADFRGCIVTGTKLGGYMYLTILPDGRVSSTPDADRDRLISEGFDF